MTISAESVYLFCFAVGFFFSVLAALSGHVDLDFHAGDSGPHDSALVRGTHHQGHRHHGTPVLNAGTVAAFLAWFGGAGWLLTRFSAVGFALVALAAVGSGVTGAALVWAFLAKVLMRGGREELDPADYEMIGVLGRVSGTIRPDGLGEILFSQAGVRRSAPARAETGSHLPNGTEVVVMRYEGGVAYVRRWEDLAGGTEEQDG